MLAFLMHGTPDLFAGRRWTILAIVTDVCVLWACAAVASAVAPGLDDGTARTLVAVLVATAIVRSGTRGLNGDRAARIGTLDTLRLSVGAVVLGTGAALAVAAVVGVDRDTPRALLLTGFLGVLAVAAARTALGLARSRARVRGVSGSRTLIVGAGWVGASLERRLRENPAIGLQVIGYLDDAPAPSFLEGEGNSPVLGGTEDLEDIVCDTGTQHVIIAFTQTPDSEVMALARRCETLGLEVSVVPRLFENVTERLWVEQVGGLPICGLRSVHPRAWQFWVKDALGRVGAMLCVIAAAPLLLLLAAAVRLTSPGPVLYRQRRIGRDGQVFDILKFRTMRVASETATVERSRLADAGVCPGGIEGDDRRTAVGAFLRRTSLDELPQLLNVLQGHMSLIGPRPERPEFVELFGGRLHRYDDRHRVKSGMTGWAQVNGLRGQTSLVERIELDNWYIQNWSLWLDLKILLLTPLEVLRSRAESWGPAAVGATVSSEEGGPPSVLAIAPAQEPAARSMAASSAAAGPPVRDDGASG